MLLSYRTFGKCESRITGIAEAFFGVFRRATGMKLIVAIIEPERLEAVQEALAEEQVFRLTVSDVEGYSTNAAAPRRAPLAITRKLKLEIAVNEAFVEPTLRAIVKGAQLNVEEASGGKVFVLSLADAVRIRTGERGAEAI